MKKVFNLMLFVAMVLMMSVWCSCGNGNNSNKQVDEQSIKDSITKVVKDSLKGIEEEKAYGKMHSKEYIEKELKSFLSEYINTNDNVRGYLSADFNSVIKKWENNPNMGEWNLLGLNSSAMVERYTIKNLSEAEDNKSKAIVLLSVDNEGEYEEEICSIIMVFENDKWVVDEINNVKKSMKSFMKEK